MNNLPRPLCFRSAITVAAMLTILLSAPVADALAQAPGVLPTRSFSVDIQDTTGHTPNIQEATLPGTTITVEYDAATYIFTWPHQRGLMRTYWMKNTGTQRVSGINVYVTNHLGTQSAGSSQLFRGLDPGERVQVAYLIGSDRIFPGSHAENWDQIAGQTIALNWTLTVFQCTDLAPDGTCRVTAPSVTVPQNVTLRALNVAQLPLDAVVAGRVSDVVTGQGISTATVEVINPLGGVRLAPFSVPIVLTDRIAGNPGAWTVNVPAMTALVRCVAPGYQTQHEVVVVAAGQTVTVNCPLKRMPWSASYTLTTTIDTDTGPSDEGTGLWGWAVTPARDAVVLTPALSGRFTPGAAFVWMIDLTTGTLAWKYPLNAQCMSPSISPDGQTVVIPRQGLGDLPAALLVLRRSDGALLRTIPIPSAFQDVASSAFSPDGTRLVVGGTFGELWLLDTADFSTVWTTIPGERQVRAVAWSPNSQTIYVSSDPGPIHAVTRASGSVRWTSYTTSFAYQDNISQTMDGTRIAVAAKYGGFVVLDQDGRDVFRVGPPEGQHAALAAPDGTYYLSTAGYQNGAHLLDPTGRWFW